MSHVFKILVIASIMQMQMPMAMAQRVNLILPEAKKSISLSFEPMPASQGNFRAIRVDAGGHTFRFVPKAPIARIPASSEERLQRGLWDHVAGLQLHSSRYFFRGEYTAGSKPHTLLFFVSEPSASDAGPVYVLGFSGNGTPYKVLERKNLDLTCFKSVGKGDALIIGKATMSQVIAGDGGNGSKAPYATTYDPFSVFVIHDMSRAEYSLSASRKYNEEHYIWAGPHSREDYAVFFNLPGHTKLVGAPASRINALLGTKAIPNLR